jgi:hypothetical protein
MMVEDSEDERENMPPPPPIIQTTTPHPAPVLQELIPIEDPAPVVLAVEVEEGEDDAWYIPPVMCCQIHTLDKYSSAVVDLVPDYVEELWDDVMAGPHQEDLPADGSEDELWANLGVNCRASPAE